MLKRLKLFFTFPLINESEQTIIARHLRILTWIAILSMLMYMILLPVFAPQLSRRVFWGIILLIIQVIVLVMIRFGRVKPAAYLSLGGFWLIFAITTEISGGIISVPFSGNLLIILSAAILLGWRAAFLFASITIIEGFALVWAELHGFLPPLSTTPQSALLMQTTYLLIGAGTLHFSTFSIKEALGKAQKELEAHQKTQVALEHSEVRYRNFIEQSIDGIWRLTFDNPIPIELPAEEQVMLIQTTGYIAESNDAIARMYGYRSSQEFNGTRLLSLYGDSPSPVNFQSTLKLGQRVRRGQGYRSFRACGSSPPVRRRG